MSIIGFACGKWRWARRAEKYVVLVVPKVKVRMEAEYSIPVPNLCDLLRESFIFTKKCRSQERPLL
jgi:hypothetical protein